jgi:hypothetical protein
MSKIVVRVAVGTVAFGLALTFWAMPANASGNGSVGLRGEKPVAQLTVANPTGQGGIHPYSGWLGPCYVSRYSTFAGGWCDGNGPDYGYLGAVKCSNGSWYFNGPYRWAGDRRGSYSACPTGYTATLGGVYIYYLGYYYNSVLV